MILFGISIFPAHQSYLKNIGHNYNLMKTLITILDETTETLRTLRTKILTETYVYLHHHYQITNLWSVLLIQVAGDLDE